MLLSFLHSKTKELCTGVLLFLNLTNTKIFTKGIIIPAKIDNSISQTVFKIINIITIESLKITSLNIINPIL